MNSYFYNTRYVKFVVVVVLLCLSMHTVYAQDPFVVVLDAGHGGHDPGNRGNGYKEKDIALNVVLMIGKALQNDPEYKVVYTRDSDKFIALHERGRIANKANADLFVSIHCNSHRTQAFGTETFVLGLHANDENFDVAKKENSVILLEENYEANYEGFDPNRPESIIGLTLVQEEYLDQSVALASLVQNSFTNSLKRKSRGVKQAGFVVLHQTFMPSVLIELGFLTNTKEGRYLNSKKGQENMSASIIKSIRQYKENLDLQYNVSVQTTANSTTESSTEAETTSNEGVIFKVQIGAGTVNYEASPENFKGLSQISKRKVGELYKYYFGHSTSYSEIQKLKAQAIEKGYDSSFIVAFRNGEAIALEEALKM